MSTTNTATIIGFGKYRNLCVEHVFDIDPNYCRWVSFQKSINLKSEITDFIDSKFKAADDGSYIMNWGRHKGKSLKTIKLLDARYLDWLHKSKFVKGDQAWLIEKIDEL
ncbi:hypothetical protein PHYSODRAFT_475064 [Phytophthora sojae]|uniref:Uncharacterized protein n=1 Tax=Phytophthora sojae (strain P6497) TaxID=1094619 RepID=G4YND2_PHYSP|nr:hypothetical protein PHYSODRAFT_475064 [Phytophthora sojae]EGZ30225.1 hypothetical protein PHYSODRAFT_475064 [Phytophthora sojae]|eukprot:XP_009517500.1 hypothetical protein PHYSODRAFT_475064 [Phytophthora sojae]